MKVKLKFLFMHTTFEHDKQVYRKAGFRGDQVRCEPFLGGRFQTHPELVLWLSSDAEVEVK